MAGPREPERLVGVGGEAGGAPPNPTGLGSGSGRNRTETDHGPADSIYVFGRHCISKKGPSGETLTGPVVIGGGRAMLPRLGGVLRNERCQQDSVVVDEDSVVVDAEFVFALPTDVLVATELGFHHPSRLQDVVVHRWELQPGATVGAFELHAETEGQRSRK